MNMNHTSHRNNRGQGLVEFALIAPILLFVVMGVVDFGRAMIVYAQGSGALRNAARYAEVWGGAAADNHQYLECGDGEAIQQLASQVMFANVSTEIIFVKKGYFDQGDDFADDGEYTITCAEAKANPDALQTGDMLIMKSTGSFNPITPLISGVLPTASFEFRAQRTIIANLNVGETTSTSGVGVVNCSVGSTQPEVTVRASRPTSVPEGGSAVFTFSLCEPSATTVRANYTVGGTASPADFTGIVSSEVVFTPGQQTVTIPVDILVDAIQENVSETIIVTLTGVTTGNAALGNPSVATVFIMNDNPSGLCSQLEVRANYLSWGAIQIKVQNVGSHDYDYSNLRIFYYFTRVTSNTMGADASRQTGDNVDLAATSHMISGNDGYLEIRVTNSGTLRGSSNDYVSGSLQLHEGSNYNFGNSSNFNDDYSSYGVPTNSNPTLVSKIPLELSGTVVCGEHPNGSNGGGGGTNYPTVSISPGSMSVNEGSTANMTVSLSHSTTSDVTVQLTYTGNVLPGDYSPPTPPSTVTIPAGQTSVPLNVAIYNDSDEELQETLYVSLANVTTGNATIHFSNNMTAVSIPENDSRPSVSISPSTVTVEEGQSTPLTVRLSGAATSNVMVEYTLTGGTASASDFSPNTTPGSVTIPMGSTTATLNISAVDDSVQENAETIVVTLNRVTSVNADINNASKVATVTIPANDTLPTITLSANPTSASVTEGSSITFTATLTGGLNGNTVTVDYGTVNGTAISGSDFTAVSGTFTFTPSDSGPKSISVSTSGDSTPEGNKSFDFRLSNPVNAALGTPVTVTATIVDDDLPAISISYQNNNQTLTEGETRDIILTLSLASPTDVTVRCDVNTASSTATYGTDFDFRPSDANTYSRCNDTITFPANTTQRTIRVRTNQTASNDSIDEDDETVVLTFTNPNGATLASNSAQVTIIDNDSLPTINISDAATVTEGTHSNAVFTVTLSPASGRTVQVAYNTSNGSALAGQDYTETIGTLSFTVGETSKTVSVPITNDAAYEVDENFYLNLSSPQNTNLGTDVQGEAIIHSEDPEQPSLSINDVTVSEGDGYATFTVTLSAVSSQAVSVTYNTQSGSANSNDYYVQTNQTFTIPANTLTKSLNIQLKEDSIEESDEYFDVVFTNPTNATIADGTGRATIKDNDGVLILSLTSCPNEVVEPASGSVTVSVEYSLNRPNSYSGSVWFNFNNRGSGTTASAYSSPPDFDPINSQKQTIGTAYSSVDVSFQVYADNRVEGNETIVVQAISSYGVDGQSSNVITVQSVGPCTITIIDSD